MIIDVTTDVRCNLLLFCVFSCMKLIFDQHIMHHNAKNDDNNMNNNDIIINIATNMRQMA